MLKQIETQLLPGLFELAVAHEVDDVIPVALLHRFGLTLSFFVEPVPDQIGRINSNGPAEDFKQTAHPSLLKPCRACG